MDPRGVRVSRGVGTAGSATPGVDRRRFDQQDGQKRPHVDAATLLQDWLTQVFGARFVNPEAPIDVAPEDNPTNEPVPDLIVPKRSFSKFRSASPQPEDLDLVVEV